MAFANVGNVDRVIRVIAGAVLIAMPALGTLALSSTLGLVSMIVGIVLVVTGFVSFCPLYRLLGLRTNPKA